MRKIVLTGGGTAGHVMPHIALLPYLKNSFDEIHYIGSYDGIERRIISRYNSIIYHGIDCAKLVRSFTLKNLTIPVHLINGYAEARKILAEIKPDVLFSKGGYVSVPPVLAAPKSCPVIIHESDFTVGMANRISIKKASLVLTAFSSTASKIKKAEHVGCPIRQELYSGDKSKVLREFSLSGHKPILLAMGGSLGAKAINDALRAALPRLLSIFDIIHITGKGHINASYNYPNYIQIEFRPELADFLAAADVVVSRAGAGAIFELAATKKPMLLIPLPKGASRGDQIQNARYFELKGMANVLPQENITSDTLVQSILTTYHSKDKLLTAISQERTLDGTKLILDKILSFVN